MGLSQKRLEDFYISKINIPNPYPELFTDLGGKFKFSAQDSDLEYLFWRCKNPPVSSELQPPLALGSKLTFCPGTNYVVVLIQFHYPGPSYCTNIPFLKIRSMSYYIVIIQKHH